MEVESCVKLSKVRLLNHETNSVKSGDENSDCELDTWDTSIEFQFEDRASEATFYGLLNVLNMLSICFIMCLSCSICSSNYTMHESALDSIMLAIDIFFVDLTSSFFVVSGFVCGFIYSSVGLVSFQNLRRHMLVCIIVDLWISGICAILFGSLNALLLKQFHFQDVLFTLFEHITAFRFFDVRQNLNAPHTYNLGSWPIQCFVWCLLTVHMTYTGNDFLRSKFGQMGAYAIMISAVCGIVLFTLFGMLHNHSNIFYANSTNFTYRTLEFNLGIHFFYLVNMNEMIATTLMRFVHQSSRGILFLFICIWWSEIGSKTNLNVDADVCLRMYPRNQCLRDHHAFLLRGCCLGITLISTFAYENCTHFHHGLHESSAKKHILSLVNIYSTAVAFCWPAFLAIQLIFQITFSQELIERNMALMSILQPMFLFAGAVLYSLFVKPQISSYAQEQIGVAYVSFWSLWNNNSKQNISPHNNNQESVETTHNYEVEIPDLSDIEDLDEIHNV